MEKETKLTAKQEAFVDGIMQGKTQYESYITAYPNAKKWQRQSIDIAASQLMDNNKIIIRLKELGWKDKSKVEWTRKKALETINYVMDMNKKDMERIANAYEEDLQRKDLELQDWVKMLSVPNVDTQQVQAHIQQILDEMSALRKLKRVNATNTKGIFEGAKILNRMFGYDITKVEVKQVDEEKDNMKSLSVEELKALAYANKNKEE